jgi:hypothetical protein
MEKGMYFVDARQSDSGKERVRAPPERCWIDWAAMNRGRFLLLSFFFFFFSRRSLVKTFSSLPMIEIIRLPLVKCVAKSRITALSPPFS